MKKLLYLSGIVLSLSVISTNAQTVTVVNDKALNGQLKRMVFMQWNDWQPSPNSWRGILFWRLAYNEYYKGSDKRPYKIGGIVDQDIAQAYYFADMEKKMADTIKDIAKDEALNYASKSGGVLDYPYSLYYKKIFEDLNNQVKNAMAKLLLTNPSVYTAVAADKYYRDYEGEFLELINERIQTVHHSFGEKGDRILSYIEIHREFERKNEQMLQLIQLYKKLVPLEAARRPRPVEIHSETDREIRLKILAHLSF